MTKVPRNVEGILAANESLLRAADANPDWQKHIESYMMGQLYKTRAGIFYRLLGKEAAAIMVMGAGLISCAVAIIVDSMTSNLWWLWSVGLTTVGTAASAGLLCWGIRNLFRGSYWRTNNVGSAGNYLRDFKTWKLPPEVFDLMRRISGFLPGATFKVSFLGEDPVFWVNPEHKSSDIAVLVWEEGENPMDIKVIDPPSA